MRKQSFMKVQGEIHWEGEQSKDYEKFGELPQRPMLGFWGGHLSREFCERGSVWEKLTLRVAAGPQWVLSCFSSLGRMERAGGTELYKCSLCSDSHLIFSSYFVNPAAPTELDVKSLHL